jgi:uncharacterized protein with PIN domain
MIYKLTRRGFESFHISQLLLHGSDAGSKVDHLVEQIVLHAAHISRKEAKVDQQAIHRFGNCFPNSIQFDGSAIADFNFYFNQKLFLLRLLSISSMLCVRLLS